MNQHKKIYDEWRIQHSIHQNQRCLELGLTSSCTLSKKKHCHHVYQWKKVLLFCFSTSFTWDNIFTLALSFTRASLLLFWFSWFLLGIYKRYVYEELNQEDKKSRNAYVFFFVKTSFYVNQEPTSYSKINMRRKSFWGGNKSFIYGLWCNVVGIVFVEFLIFVLFCLFIIIVDATRCLLCLFNRNHVILMMFV